MKISLALLFLSFLLLHCKSDLKDTANIAELKLKETETDSLLVQESKKDTIIKTTSYPWSSAHPCTLNKYNIKGLIPAMRDSLIALSLEKRLTNGLNTKKKNSNYHGADYVLNGKQYSAAIDISVRCLNANQIRSLLHELSMRGFAGWYRKKGKDGWNGDEHIHAIWVAAPLKKQLSKQVKKWLAGKNGLTSDKDYKFWTPKPRAIKLIRKAYLKSNPV